MPRSWNAFNCSFDASVLLVWTEDDIHPRESFVSNHKTFPFKKTRAIVYFEISWISSIVIGMKISTLKVFFLRQLVIRPFGTFFLLVPNSGNNTARCRSTAARIAQFKRERAKGSSLHASRSRFLTRRGCLWIKRPVVQPRFTVWLDSNTSRGFGQKPERSLLGTAFPYSQILRSRFTGSFM